MDSPPPVVLLSAQLWGPPPVHPMQQIMPNYPYFPGTLLPCPQQPVPQAIQPIHQGRQYGYEQCGYACRQPLRLLGDDDNNDNDLNVFKKGKLFVGALSLETTKERLQNYFQTSDKQLTECEIKMDRQGRSRGFGYVTFKTHLHAYQTLKDGPHEVSFILIFALSVQ